MSINFQVLGLSDQVTSEVRETLRAPEYGHPAVCETARGTGPCRACLDTFRVGEEERLLFTHRPPGEAGTLGAPGPVFIHAHSCAQYRGAGFPPGLRALPLFIEARASENRILATRRATGAGIESALEELLMDERVDYLHLRHGEAGCFIARVDRVGPGGSAGLHRK